MKKTIYLLLAIVIGLSSQTASATSTSYASSFGEPQKVDYLNFTATLQTDGSIQTNWDPYSGGDLLYYKLSRSQTNSNPVYPEDGYIFYSSSKASYTDDDAPIGTNYYRVCAITSAKDRYCSNVVTIETSKDEPICAQVITYAEKNGECKEYATPCDVPEKWTTVDSCIAEEASGEIILNVEIKDNKPYLDWSFKDGGNAPNGYKIAISTKNKNPTYPVMSGDSFTYLSDENTTSYHHTNAKSGSKYYYRICLYLGNGECESYSNSISITAQGESTTTETSEEQNTLFKDVPAGIWFESYLNSFVERGIIDGYSDGTFQPSRTVNRAEMSKMIVKALGVNPEENDMDIFCDVDTNDWFHAYVMHLYFENIVEGYIGGECPSNREYKPSQDVTRAEGIKIILAIFDANIETLSSGEQTGFTDVEASHWAAAYIRTAFQIGIVRGYDDGSFHPNTYLSRAEFVKMLSEAEDILK